MKMEIRILDDLWRYIPTVKKSQGLYEKELELLKLKGGMRNVIQ